MQLLHGHDAHLTHTHLQQLNMSSHACTVCLMRGASMTGKHAYFSTAHTVARYGTSTGRVAMSALGSPQDCTLLRRWDTHRSGRAGG